MMPEVDGLTFLAGIRRFPKWKNMPVIMMTGMKDALHHRKAESLHVSDYLVKNEFTMPDLVQFIRKHLAKVAPATPQPI
jgi:CheY-like chemotaxis protein